VRVDLRRTLLMIARPVKCADRPGKIRGAEPD
jgi:hypothetical protein